MNIFLIDSHCHLNMLNYKHIHKDIFDVINKAKKCGVKLILSVSTNLTDSNIISITNSCKNILFSCGIHPLNLINKINLDELYYLSSLKKVVAIGETGLDYLSNLANKQMQQQGFRTHIQIGVKYNKPIIVHTRNSYQDTLGILKEEQANKCGGIIHCFTGNKTFAKKFLDLGFYLSFSGIITFSNAKNLIEIIKYVPLDRILLETDSPFLTPVPYRGTENQPAYLKYIAQFVANFLHINLEKIAEITTTNFEKLFKINITNFS